MSAWERVSEEVRIIFTPQVTTGRISQCTIGKNNNQKQTEKRQYEKNSIYLHLKLWCSSRFGDEETPWFIVPIIYGLEKKKKIYMY